MSRGLTPSVPVRIEVELSLALRSSETYRASAPLEARSMVVCVVVLCFDQFVVVYYPSYLYGTLGRYYDRFWSLLVFCSRELAICGKTEPVE